MKIKGKETFFTLEEFSKICEESESIREVKIKMGYEPDGGGTSQRIKDLIAQLNIDISHFTGQGHTKNIGKRKVPIEKYFSNESNITSHKLRIRLLEENIFEYECCCCGNSKWLDQPIPLELHHKDGNKNNNALDNLELRCPNCHYFTETYKTKNRST